MMVARAQERQSACILSIEVNPQGAGMRAEELEADRSGIEADFGDAEADDEEREAGPTEIDAGGAVTLVGTVVCSPARDLRGMAILIRDKDRTALGEAEIVDFDGEINTTRELVVKAPLRAGEHVWLAVLPVHTADGIDYEEASTSFSLIVRAHATSIVVWDVPTAIVAGQAFRFKVGVKCSSECRPAGWTFEVSDEHGDQTAVGALGDEPWPGTAALFYAEVEARAPEAEGLHDWTVSAPGADLDIPHEQHKARFGVRTVRQPECLIAVEAIDRASQLPIRGAKVVVHPYRAFTDDHGRALVRVPKGAYRIFVSGAHHVPYRAEHEVLTDTSIRAELILDLAPSDADLWS